MEVLRQYKEYGYFTSQLYHLLTKKKLIDPSEPIIPSEYLKEMRLTTAERLQRLNNIHIDNIVTIDTKKVGVPVLSFTPRIIVFQNFKPNERVVAKFTVKNISKAPTFLNMVFKESSNFFIKPCGSQLLSRLAPGISATFVVTFESSSYEDFVHRVMFYTDIDQYVVPLIAMGPRPIFDFPDQVIVPRTPLKIESSVPVNIHNVGLVNAGFTLKTKCPFSVYPRSTYVLIQKKVELKIGFKSMHLGNAEGELQAIFETGEVFHISVFGDAHAVSIGLEKETVRFLDTYNTMIRQQNFKITNKSNHLLTYMCMKNESVYDDFGDKMKLAKMFYDVKQSESLKYGKLVQYDVLSSNEHERVYTRIFTDEIQALVTEESMFFQNMHFAVSPIKGKLWPNKVTEIEITFSPKEIGEFESVCYLDIDGISNRVPLKMVGTSIPPLIQLNVETLDMDRAFINKVYNYEIVAMNKGHINGVIVYKETPTLFGSVITCTPEMHCLAPGDKSVFILSFRNPNQGAYFEEIDFFIRDTSVSIKLYLKGEIIYPTLHFSKPCLDFGRISVGIPTTLDLEVINESEVKVKGAVKISSDGPEVCSITLDDCEASGLGYIATPPWPKEFHIEPSKVDLDSESKVIIKVTLTANLPRANQTCLELEMENSDSPPITLPVSFNAVVPEITPAPDLNLRALFIDYPYKHDIIISSNEFWGYFSIEEPKEFTMEVDVEVKRGIIKPNSELVLPTTIRTSVLGPQEHTVRMFIFGLSQPIDICYIKGYACRPIVTCTPIAVHFGQVKVLVKAQRTITMNNDSPVRVYFRAAMLNKDGRWLLEPQEGYIEQEGETELIVSVYLVDACTYSNKAVIQLEKVKDIFVPVTATGVGTSIVVGEDRDRISLGRHFIKLPLEQKVTIENCGNRLHSLEWTENYKTNKNKPPVVAFFNLEPRSFKLAAGEKLQMKVTGLSAKVATVREIWYLVGSVEGINKKELLLECPVMAEFVEPKVEVSSTLMNFRYDHGPYSEYYKLTDILTIKNVSKLALMIDLNVRAPFAIIQKKDTYRIPSDEENLCCCICYNENDLDIQNIISETGPNQSKIFIDFLTNQPVEPLREGALHFFHDIRKLKMAFHLTHNVEQRLEDQEVMKLQILFDTTKHLNLKSKVYSDVMKIKFRGHKNKDAVRLVASINFPNMFLLTPKVDFNCILNDTVESKTIRVHNITPLNVCYKFQWKKCSIKEIPTLEKPKLEYEDDTKTTKSSKLSQDLQVTAAELLDTEVQEGDGDVFDKTIVPPVAIEPTGSEIIRKAGEDFNLRKIKIMRKIAPMLRIDYELPNPWTNKFGRRNKTSGIDINDVLLIMPHRGLLKPKESQYIQVIFNPRRNINVKATLECEVLGGPSEYITITGQSSDLMYTISTQKLNFKIRSFHEHAKEVLVITNVAQLPFEYKTYLNEPKLENELPATIVDLVPSEKTLEPEEEVSMSVVVRPGVVGYFHRTFLMEIGHFPAMPIEIFGWGVVPQVYLCLPRPQLFDLPPLLGYLAIPTLTSDFLGAINEVFTKSTSEHLNSPQVEECFEDKSLKKEWHICSAWDEFPSKMDIELAIERMLVINHIKSRPEIMNMYTQTSKMGPIPGFITTPYVIDFGVVITGSVVQRAVEVKNYGPIATKLHFSKSYSAHSWLIIKLCGKLEPGDTGRIDFSFCPTPQDFKEVEQPLELTLYLEVPYGVIMPIEVKALCAVPYLKSNVSIINLGKVRCGDKIICSIPLRNVGKPTCIWYAMLKVKTSGPNPIEILDSSGRYEPGEGGWLSIAFKPTIELVYEAVLIFRFHMNPTKMTIPVVGQGVFPHVHLIGPKISFPPTLPWAETTDMYFGLTNPCSFPIEIIVAHADGKWKEEDEIYNLLYKYYNKPGEILLPIVKPGKGLPIPVLDFFNKFKTNVRRNIEEEAAAMKSVIARTDTRAKKGKSPKPKSAVPSRKESIVVNRKFRSEAEIIADEIKAMKEEGLDPLADSHLAADIKSIDELTSLTPSYIEPSPLKGLLLFVHGTPCDEMEYRQLSYTLGMQLRIPTINIDTAFVEALCDSNCFAKTLLLSAINSTYDSLKKITAANNDSEPDDVLEGEENDDSFDVIQMKLEFLANSKNIVTPRSKGSDKKKKSEPSDASQSVLPVLGSSTMFNMDYTAELLTDYFNDEKFRRGFVVESLTSQIIKPPSLALATLIKCKRSIQNIHLVMCHTDLNKWIQAYEDTQRAREALEENASRQLDYSEADIKNIVNDFDKMNADDYEKSNPELKQLYITHALESRRRKYLEKKLKLDEKYGRQDSTHKKERSIKADASASVIDRIDSKRKLKKDEIKAKTPTVKPRLDDEVVNMTTKYNDYMKNVYESLINIATNWIIEEGDVGLPLYAINGHLVGAPAKKAKKKSEVQLLVSEIIVQERGFPLTLLLSSGKGYENGLVNMFQTTPFLSNALKEDEEFDILKCPVNIKQYTVLLPKILPHIHHEEPLEWLYLEEKPLKKCECDQVLDLQLMDDTNQDNVLHILSKWHCVCGKKVASSQTSTTEIPTTSIEKIAPEMVPEEDLYPLPLRSVKAVPVPSSRIVLQPGELVRFKYAFSPKLEGNYTVKRYIEVAGWPESRVEISVNGISDLPRLDNRPKKMFRNFVRRRLEDTVYKSTYLDDLKMFEFGPIFIGGDRIYEEEYTIDLRNASLMTADIEIQFLEDVQVFQIDKTFIRLEPGNRDKLTITAAPDVMGVHTAVLLFCVKDNPEIVRVTIGCSGVIPVVEILPITKIIDYNKLLLYRREDDRFIIKNDSILPVMWKVRNADEFVEDFIISQTSGIIPRNDNKVVPVTYIACNVGVITNKQMIIDIYDELGRGDPMIIDALYLSGECYDVMVECAYENPNETFLNFGNVKVNSSEYKDMYLLNRGKYPIYYKLKKVKKFPEPALLKSFNACDECGMIPPTLKLVTVEFGCTPTTSINLNNVPAYTCSLLDGSKEQVVVAKFPVCVTIASFYNTFTLFPLGELNFNIIAVGSGVMRDVILNNTSKCPFTYEIIVPEKYCDPATTAAAAPKVGKDNKIKNPPIKCGNFLILNEDNLLAPGMSRTIQIQFLATAAKKFEETINFIVSDTCPAEAQGVPLKLVGTGAMPTLDLWNLETTFREHLIVKNMKEYKIKEPSPHCVFAEDTVTLHFFGVTINNQYTAYIDLYNNGLVACALFNKLHYQDNTNDSIFALDKYEMHIEPLLHKTLGIIFSPNTLTEFRAVLEIKLKLLQNEEQSFKICLIGKGVIPRIKLVQPMLRQHKLGVTVFPMTCLGSISHKVIKFKNISSVKSVVFVRVQQPAEDRPVFYINIGEQCEHMTESIDKVNTTMRVVLVPEEICSINTYFNPLYRGRTSCDVQMSIEDNPYEYFMVLCEAEAFMEDVILLGLEMLSMEYDIDLEIGSSASAGSGDKKKPKSAPMMVKRKSSLGKKKKASHTSVNKQSDSSTDASLLKYVLDFGGCELCSLQKRSVIMVNNSEKVFKFSWETGENIVIKPSLGYISPGEEKDLEIMFFSLQPYSVKKEPLICSLTAISDYSLVIDHKGTTWDNRQTLTSFEHNPEISVEERREFTVGDQSLSLESTDVYGYVNIVILYSVSTEYTKYQSDLEEEIVLKDTFIYQTRSFEFKVENIGNVPLKVDWNFYIDDEYPARIDKYKDSDLPASSNAPSENVLKNPNNSENQNDSVILDNIETSRETLFSRSTGRQSVDTWFEIDLPFTITPKKDCLKPRESRIYKVSFSPLEAFDFKIRLKSNIENLDPYDQKISCTIIAKSLIPYVHLDIPESDYLTSGRRKTAAGIALPPHMIVLEFNVLGSGCYKKTFNVINPTNDGYEFVFELVTFGPELIPFHCNTLKGFVEGGTSLPVTMTFAPTAPGTYESQWKFIISKYNMTMNLLVVGFVREPDVLFVPPILIIRNSLVGFTVKNVVILKNNETESLNFQFRGNSMCNESGKTPVVINPEEGVLKPRSETRITIEYTPIQDGPLSFKIFCFVMYSTKYLTLCVNALSHLVKPTVNYYLINSYEHTLDSEVDTIIHLDETASTYERTIPFRIRNDGSATFQYEWNYVVTPVKKYLTVRFEPRTGFLPPGQEVICTMHFLLKQVPVIGYPVTLTISDGPVYSIFLYSEIAKPAFHFSCRQFDFGKCIVDAPDRTYKKNLSFKNDEKTSTLTLDFTSKLLPELFVDFHQEPVLPGSRLKIPVFFRPKQVKEYEFKLQFWVNSLCEEIITIRGEGVPLLLDLYEGCQKSFDLGPVKVGDKIIREIEVMNHSKVPLDVSLIFEDMHPKIDPGCDRSSLGSSICLHPNTPNNPIDHLSRVKQVQMYRDVQNREQIEKDIKNALASVKVVPSRCIIKPHMKVPLKIHFKPVGLIASLNVQLNAKVLEKIKPLVLLSGSATGMLLYFSQNSLQFGRVRKRGCRILRVMLNNKGDFGARFNWQPLKSDEFTISPMQGYIDARTTVTFTITYRPTNYNPFVKVWASCNIDNYKPQELALYATCVDFGVPQSKSLFMECPVRSVKTEYVTVPNPTDDAWLVLSEISGGPFETLKEFVIDPNTTFEIPIHFKPRTMGRHETQVLYSPLGETALFINIVGAAVYPNSNGDLTINVPAKETHGLSLTVHNITEKRETYIVETEVVKLNPEKFDGFYEIKYPDTVQVWGEAAGKCWWQYTCYEPCEMQMKVMFINEESREFQFYNITAIVTPSQIVDTLIFVSRARESVQQEIMLSNPLDEDDDFFIKCDKLECPEVIRINRHSNAKLTMTYSPLVVGTAEDYLEIHNELIGVYMYKVLMTCVPAKEKNLEFSTTIGNRIPIRLRLQNKSDFRADFVCTVSHPCIQMDKDYVLQPGEKGKFLVWFEPTDLGVQNCRISFNSPVAGEFIFNIKGIAQETKPQGPYEIKAGGMTFIKFKNVFEDTHTFKIFVDHEDFYVKTSLEQIKSKKDIKVTVYLSDRGPRAQQPTGCLTIENFEPFEPRVQWTYFLHGKP